MRLTQKQSLLSLFAICAVCLLGWFMFVHHLRYESMWTDEWFSWQYSQMGPLELTRSTAQDVHPPLYYTLLWLWTSLSGSQDLLVMRLTAAFPALLAVAVGYRLGCDWFKSRWAGLGAAVFLATSGILIYYARELRMYALVVLLAAASWWYLWRWLHRGGRTAALGYLALVALMLYTYYFSGFMVVTQLVYVAFFYRRRWFGLVRLLVVSGLIFLPWVPVVFHQMDVERQISKRGELFGKYNATAPTTIENITLFLNTYTAKQSGLVLLLALLALLLAYQTATSAAFRRWVMAAALWCFFTITTFFVLNLWFPIYNLRYPLPIITGLALLVGVTVYLLRSDWTRLGVIVFLAVVGMVSHFDGFLPARAPY
ncbi:MAG TPA: glycosyltransferase family 39 protein, partial [Phototrophicaceae bacterium]|nr:glycosyltransferase family 39 protein [Phototrophicaceae bacterium]